MASEIDLPTIKQIIRQGDLIGNEPMTGEEAAGERS